MNQLIVANWKMNGSLELLEDCVTTWQTTQSKSRVVFCPPFPLIRDASKLITRDNFYVGAQDCHTETQGAFTGCVSALMLKNVGCSYVIVGHSERRQEFAESSSMIQAKAQRALEAGLMPIICVGETLNDYEDGLTNDVIREQIRLSCPVNGNFVIAYEPIWAIGTGKTAILDEIEKAHGMIQSMIDAPLLYGGSVTADNAHEILRVPHVNGVLVGGASLKPQDFLRIIESGV